MKKYVVLPFVISLLFFAFTGCGESPEKESAKTAGPEFTFAFLTDIHVQPERHSEEGFKKAIDKVNELNPDFVVTGGDLIMDALGQNYSRADSLYNIYDSLQQFFTMPVYNTMGNHEVFGLYEKSGVSPDHKEYGKNLFEHRFGKRYYSFDKDNWHFMILDVIGFTPERRYIGKVDSVQMEWIKKDLADVDSTKNIIVSIHIPLVTTFLQHYYNPLEPNTEGVIVTNANEVLELFNGKNLKLVLQGHTHILEDVFIDGIHFVTGGSVAARWWTGSNLGTEEGFLFLKVWKDHFTWEYIDYGWEVSPEDKITKY